MFVIIEMAWRGPPPATFVIEEMAWRGPCSANVLRNSYFIQKNDNFFPPPKSHAYKHSQKKDQNFFLEEKNNVLRIS